jgi:hypothetical protein
MSATKHAPEPKKRATAPTPAPPKPTTVEPAIEPKPATLPEPEPEPPAPLKKHISGDDLKAQQRQERREQRLKEKGY